VASGPARRLVGRRRERRLLRHLLDEARAGRHGLVVISGVPGVGKTALVDWLAAEATDALVLRTAGDPRSPPFGPLRRLLAPLPGLVDRHWRRFTTPASPEGERDSAAAVDLVAADLLDVLAGRARRQMVVVVVDDADDLDAASAQVAERLLVDLDDAGTRHGLHLLGALTTNASPEADGLAHRMLRLGSARSMPLGGLDEHDVFELLSATGRRPNPERVRQVMARSGGLPLLIDAAAAPGPNLRVRTIADALRLRIDKIDDEGRELLRYAALLPEPWEVDELASVAGSSGDTVARQLDDAVAAGLVGRDAAGLRFSHPLLRAELAVSQGSASVAARHGAIAARLGHRLAAADPPNDELVLRHADHVLQAHEHPGGPASADLATVVRGAGLVAMRWGAWHEASRFLAAGLRLGSAVPADVHVGHLIDAGTAAWFDNDLVGCEAHLGAAIELASLRGDAAGRLRAAIQLVRARVGERPLRPGERPEVSELDEALLVDGDVDAGLLIEGRAALADALFATGDSDRALDLVDESRRLATRATPAQSVDRPLSRLATAEGLHRLARLEVGSAGACFDEAMAHAVTAGDTWAVLMLRSRRALVSLIEGRLREARRELVAVEGETFGRRFWGEAGFAAAQLALAAALAADDEAADIVERACRLYRRSGHAYTAAVVSPALAALSARRPGGEPKPEGESDDDPSLQPSSAVSLLCAVEANDLTATRAGLAVARWRDGIAGPVTLANLPAVAALVEVGDLLGDSERVAAALPPLLRADQAGVAVILGWPATITRLLAIAARHAGDHRETQRHVERALQLTEREGLRAERAKVLVEVARLESAASRRDAAAAILAEAAQIFDACWMLGWLARCEAVASELGLADALSPSRVVHDRTILTDDIVGSTAANARLGDALYLELLRIHNRLVRTRLREFGGIEIKHTGDGVNAIFRHAADAVRCSLAIQTDFRSWARDEGDLALQVRCGLARGSLIPAEGDYFGLVQSEAARLCAMADPGEVLAGGRVVQGLDTSDFVAHDLGEHRLRGLQEDMTVLRLTPP